MSDLYNKEEIEREWEENYRQFDARRAQRQEKLQERKARAAKQKKIKNGVLAVLAVAVLGCGGWLISQGRLTQFLPGSAQSAGSAPTAEVAQAESSSPAAAETAAPETVSAETEEAASAAETTEAVPETEDLTLDDDASRDSGSVPSNEEIASFFTGFDVDASSAPLMTDEEIDSTYAVLVDLDNGSVLAQKEASTVINPASMTKILTILVAAEHLTQEDLDDTVEITEVVTDYVYANDCSTVGFEVGEKVTVRDLFYGTILPSGGDAALALARYVAGSQPEFVKLMNEKLESLGLSDTAHFTNCIGLYDEDHHCTVTDMAMILKAAVQDTWCRQVLSEHNYTTTATEQHPEGINISNWFLRRIEDKDTHGEVRCAKTGFVNEAGCCAASYQISGDGGHYICVTANTYSTWRSIYDHVQIYADYTN